MVNEVTEKDFAVDENGVMIADFWAPWCGNCRMMMPFVEKMSDELGDSVKVVKINTQEEEGLAKQFGVMSLPTLIVFKDGKELQRLVGPRPYLKMLNEIKGLI